MGNDAGLFSGAWDADDKEADQVWEKIEDHMDSRRAKQREERQRKELEEYES